MNHESNTEGRERHAADEHQKDEAGGGPIFDHTNDDSVLEEAMEHSEGAVHIFGDGQAGAVRNKKQEPRIIGILLNMKKNSKKDKKDKPKARPVFGNEDLDAQGPETENTREFTKNGRKLSYSSMSFDEFDMKESKIKKTPRKQDKIFENNYNTGSTETSKLPDIKVSGDYADSRLEECYNSEQYSVKRDLLDKVYEIYNNSQWKGLPNDKKFPKELAPFIFNDLWNGLNTGDGHSAMDMFIAIAEFMDTSYEKVYEAAGLKVKEQVIHELQQKYKMFEKKKINRLF